MPIVTQPSFANSLPGFQPRRWLTGGHAQTLAGNFLPRTNLLPPPEARFINVSDQQVSDKDGAQTQVLCHCHWQPEGVRQTAMTVVIVHGLEGSSDSQYVLGTGSKVWLEGMNVVRMNMRNCGGTEKLTPTLYHSGLSGDVGAVVRELTEKDGLKKIGLVGYSMGGNLVMKLAGEWGTAAPPEVKVAVGVSPAMDLAASADALHHLKNRMYEWKFLFKLRQRFLRKVKLFPDRYDAKYAEGLKSLRHFDDVITARYSGFTGADDYYARASSSRIAEHIATPSLVIHSTDDPFIIMAAETREKLLTNPQVALLESEHGGHCAFLADANGYDGRWAEKISVQFLKQHAL